MEDVEPIEEDEVQIAQSPTPVKAEVSGKDDRDKMDFYSAVEEMLAGRKVTKQEWGSDSYYGFMKDDLLKLRKSDGKTFDWIISRGDIEGTDYIIID